MGHHKHHRSKRLSEPEAAVSKPENLVDSMEVTSESESEVMTPSVNANPVETASELEREATADPTLKLEDPNANIPKDPSAKPTVTLEDPNANIPKDPLAKPTVTLADPTVEQVDPPTKLKRDYYIASKGSEIYAKTRDNDEFYATDKYKKPVFAKRSFSNGRLHPYTAKNKNGKPVTPSWKGLPYTPHNANDESEPIYASSYEIENGKEIYPQQDQSEMYNMYENGTHYFARDEMGDMYYATHFNADNERVQYLPQPDMFIETEDNKKVYPINFTSDRPIYQTRAGTEIYFKNQDGEYYGKNSKNDEMYARDVNEIPYFAKTIDGLPFYVKDHTGGQVYPEHPEEGQFYLEIEGTDVPAANASNQQYYAKDFNRNEFYPSCLSD